MVYGTDNELWGESKPTFTSLGGPHIVPIPMFSPWKLELSITMLPSWIHQHDKSHPGNHKKQQGIAKQQLLQWRIYPGIFMALNGVYPLVNDYIAIEHGHRNSWFSHQKWWFSIVMLVYQRVYGITNRPLCFSLDIIQDWVDWLVQRDWTGFLDHTGSMLGNI